MGERGNTMKRVLQHGILRAELTTRFPRTCLETGERDNGFTERYTGPS